MTQPSSSASNNDSQLLIGQTLTLRDIEQVAREHRPVALCPQAQRHVLHAREAIDALVAEGENAPAVYGVNTGFGYLAETRIPTKDIQQLQLNLIRSHACGVGPALGIPEVRAMILLRAQVLALGYSGVRKELIDLLLALLNQQVHPYIPAQGSVGASGDLAPLAHLALVLVGEGEAFFEAQSMSGAEALHRAGLHPLRLEAKEGLSLINGTQYMAALGALAVREALRLCTIADIAGAISLEAIKGSMRPFEDRLIMLRPHPGQLVCAQNLRMLLRDSRIMESHAHCSKVQDAYSFRCMPQVHGATRDALSWISDTLTREVNSVTDNPIVFAPFDGSPTELISGGNFHGQPLALALDLAAMALSELANISERRVEQLVNPALSSGLTPFLAKTGGLESGFMLAQVTSASLVSENKVLCHPACVDSIPSSAGKEDHVSMGSISARKLMRIVDNVRHCLAIELLAGSAAIDQRAPLLPAAGVRAGHRAIRSVIPPLLTDRPLYQDIAKTAELISSGVIRAACESSVGALGLAQLNLQGVWGPTR